jgi:hypothetical protein
MGTGADMGAGTGVKTDIPACVGPELKLEIGVKVPVAWPPIADPAGLGVLHVIMSEIPGADMVNDGTINTDVVASGTFADLGTGGIPHEPIVEGNISAIPLPNAFTVS